MTVPEYVARQTERMAESLAHFIATTPDDKLNWTPNVGGAAAMRPVLAQIGECVSVNRYMAALARGESVSIPSGGRPEIAFRDSQDAQAQLKASAQELANALRGLSDADLERTFAHPRGPIRGENFLVMGFRNMAYHAGQINFIQMLCGDPEFHVPPTWR